MTHDSQDDDNDIGEWKAGRRPDLPVHNNDDHSS